MFAVHLFLFFNGFKHEGSARFGSWRQTAVFVFMRSARRTQQPAPSSDLVPLLGVWLGKQPHVKNVTEALPGIKYLPERNRMSLLVAPQWLQLFESCSLSSLSRSSSLAELASTAEETRQRQRRLHFISTEGKRVSSDRYANLNNCVTMCWWQLPPSESLLCERKAVAVVVGKLWFLQRQEFFSSGNRS